MDTRKKIIIGTLITLAFLLLGTIGYATIEGFTLVDAFYMTVITISTVGFGEIHPLSGKGRIFTIFLIMFGFSSLGFLASVFMEAIVEKTTGTSAGTRKMKKRIAQLKNHVIICGFGRVGEAAADHFDSVGKDFVVIENSSEQLKRIREYGFAYLEGDATREDTLLAAGIKQGSALLAMLNSDPENLFIVLTARELNPTLKIIARTESATSESRMLRAGADTIISPYVAAGRSVAEKIMGAAGLEKTGRSSTDGKIREPEWVTVDEQSDLIGHVIDTAGGFLSAKIVGLRRGNHDLLMPKPDEKVLPGDQLLLVHPDDRSSGMSAGKRWGKIILIDDNPVILRLYTRLFQKAGFHMLTATNAHAGLALIHAEKPNAAVIDFELPDMSGIDLCRKLRSNPTLATMKLFLFTANEENEIHQTAIEAGVDTVVIKSPDAAEIVRTVQERLQ